MFKGKPLLGCWGAVKMVITEGCLLLYLIVEILYIFYWVIVLFWIRFADGKMEIVI